MISWFTRNGVAANLVMLVLVLGGIGAALTMKRELFPQFSLDTIIVRVPFLGASPEEVEELVVIRIEEALQGLDGIKEMNSTAQENYGSVMITVDKGYDISKVKDDVKNRVDAITTFPADTERPIIEELLIQKDVIRISIFGDASEREIKKLTERIRDEIVELDSISQAIVEGVRSYEISIEVSENSLRQYNLTFDHVVQAVRANSIDLPGGLIKAAGGEISLRLKEQAYDGQAFGDIVILSTPDGAQVRVSDVATVNDGFAEQDMETTFNGKPAGIVLIREVGEENPLQISKDVYQYVEEAQATWIPEGIQLEAWSDSSFYLQGRINMLLKNGFYGFLLVLASLAIFLRPTLAFFVAIGIPISFLATLAISPMIGITINLLSLFAFILVLGIVVDDAIVVGESVFTQFQRTGPGVESAIKGTQMVSMPVTFAIITTIVAFLPVFLLPGTIGKFMAVIPYAVIPTLLFSLVQSKLVLPYHLSLCNVGDKQGREKLNWFSRFQRLFSDGLEHFIESVYQPFLKKALKYRYTTAAAFVACLAFAVFLIFSGFLRFVFFPKVPSDYLFVELNMAEGTPISETQRYLNLLETKLEELRQDEVDAGRIDPVANKGVFLGYSVISGGPGPAAVSNGSNIGSIILELEKSDISDSNAEYVSNLWREMVGPIPGARKLDFLDSAAGPVGLPIDIKLTGRSFDDLKAASLEIQEEIKNFAGYYDIRDNYAEGKLELKVSLKDYARTLGITSSDLGRQIRNAFYGAEAQRVQRDGEDVKVMVRYPRAERESLGNLESMRIVAPDGSRIPISEVADLEYGVGYPTISRNDARRTINVRANANKEIADTDKVNTLLYGDFMTSNPKFREFLRENFPSIPKEKLQVPILERITSKYLGIKPLKAGEAKDMEEAGPAMLGGFLVVVVMIYALLAIPFKSYLQPFIVISVIPFGVGGAIYGHLFGRQDISLLSFMGIIAMAGVVVNDSLVLVERINRLRNEGIPLRDAVRIGGTQRFRAILLTSVTTFVGLFPILMERSLQAQFLIPMATSLAFGVLFATFITLLLVPSLYLILEDIKWFFTAVWRRYTRLFK
ncbi:MAG: efflux RND transporter permease subunit [Verrucomicrobiota bacterium]